MVGASQGEEVHVVLKDYVAWLRIQEMANLSSIYDKKMAPFLGEGKTIDDITYVILRNHLNVLENLSLATLKEMIGLGSWLYCVI